MGLSFCRQGLHISSVIEHSQAKQHPVNIAISVEFSFVRVPFVWMTFLFCGMLLFFVFLEIYSLSRAHNFLELFFIGKEPLAFSLTVL